MGRWDLASYNLVTNVFVYNFMTRHWRRSNDMPSKHSFFAIGAFSGRVYIASGHDENKNTLESTWVYDLRKDEWAKLTRMSQEWDEFEGVVIGWWFFLSCCGLLVVVDDCAVLCWFFFFFLVDVFIIILMSYLYYFNQIAKNITPLLWGVKM